MISTIEGEAKAGFLATPGCCTKRSFPQEAVAKLQEFSFCRDKACLVRQSIWQSVGLLSSDNARIVPTLTQFPPFATASSVMPIKEFLEENLGWQFARLISDALDKKKNR